MLRSVCFTSTHGGCANALELSQLEKLETRYIIFRVLAVGIVGLIAAGIARIPGPLRGEG